MAVGKVPEPVITSDTSLILTVWFLYLISDLTSVIVLTSCVFVSVSVRVLDGKRVFFPGRRKKPVQNLFLPRRCFPVLSAYRKKPTNTGLCMSVTSLMAEQTDVWNRILAWISRPRSGSRGQKDIFIRMLHRPSESLVYGPAVATGVRHVGF